MQFSPVDRMPQVVEEKSPHLVIQTHTQILGGMNDILNELRPQDEHQIGKQFVFFQVVSPSSHYH